MSAAIQQAAISYFGLPDGTQMVEGGPLGCFAFIIPLTEEHMRGIADRMKALSEPTADSVPTWSPPLKTREELRAQYNGMPATDKAVYGSFGRYWAESTMGMAQDDAIEPEAQGAGGRKVMHVNAPEEEQTALPETVWVPGYALDATQILMASDHNVARNRYLVQVAMLNESQRYKYAMTDRM